MHYFKISTFHTLEIKFLSWKDIYAVYISELNTLANSNHFTAGRESTYRKLNGDRIDEIVACEFN